MYSKAKMGASAIELARACLATSGQPMELLLMYSFDGDVEAHDDDLQAANLTVKKKRLPRTKLRRYRVMAVGWHRAVAMGFADAQPILRA